MLTGVNLKQILVLVTVELHAKENDDGISWELSGTNCKSLPNLSITANRLYTRHCALSIGQQYRLECNGWWGSNRLVIENSVYCENPTSHYTVEYVTITGKWWHYMFISLSGMYEHTIYYHQPHLTLNEAWWKLIIGESHKQCPIDYPHSFDFGGKCCFYDKDSDENPIHSRSLSCYRNTYVYCPKDRCLDNSKIEYNYIRNYNMELLGEP